MNDFRLLGHIMLDFLRSECRRGRSILFAEVYWWSLLMCVPLEALTYL
jgi:hypothetical protein